MRALLSSAPLGETRWIHRLGPNPPLLDSTLADDVAATLRQCGVDDIFAPADDPLADTSCIEPVDAIGLRGTDPVVVLVVSGPVRFDPRPLRRALALRGSGCAIALLPRGRRSSLPRVATDPLGGVELIQPAATDSPVTNLRDTGVRIAGADIAMSVLAAGLDTAALASQTTLVSETTSCRWQRDLLTPESFLICCYELLTGQAGEWYGGCGTAPGSVVHPSVESPRDECGNVWLAEGVTVGEDTTLSRSVLLSGASVGAGCRLNGCLLLPGSSVADGADMSDKYLKIIGTDGEPSNG